MARVTPKQHSFARGEISPRLQSRQDTELYYTALAVARNYVVDGRGILERRPGTRLMGATKDNGAAALLPFVYDRDQAYVLELGDEYLRAWFDLGQVLSGGSPTETVTPWGVDEVDDLSYAQLRDVMWVAHGNHALKTIIRDSATTFSISDFELRDGPYDSINAEATTVKPAGYGSLSPVMTSNTTPTGTVIGTAGTDAWKAFDKDVDTRVEVLSDSGEIGYQLASGTEVVDGYFVRAASRKPRRMMSAWKVEGYDGSQWVVLDTQVNQVGFGVSETRYYQIANSDAYERYRISWSGTDDEDTAETWIGEVDFHIKAETQTPFNLVFSSTDGINFGTGFSSDDVGRQIRVLSEDGRWRWLKIDSINSSTSVKVVVYDQSLPTLARLTTWRLGAFYGSVNPEIVAFHENRLVLARENRVYLSASNDYSLFAPTDLDGTVNPDNAIVASIPAINASKGSTSYISFMQSLGFQLVVGTPSGIHTFQSTSFGEPLEPGTITRRFQDSRGADRSQPIVLADSVVYVHGSRRKLMGTYYRDSYDRIGAQDLSLPADHLLPSNVRGVTWQEEPHSIAWVWMDDGTVAGLTIQPEEKVQAWHSHRIGGRFVSGGVVGHAEVESMCVIPDADGGDDKLHMIVKRTVNGSTVRYVEALEPYWQLGTDPRDAWFLDAAIKYEGNTDSGKTITFTGSGTGARAAVTNFSSPAMTDGDTLVFHDGLRWHHGRISDVDGSNNFTWTPTLPNSGPGPADGNRWHYIDGAWSQPSPDERIDVYASTYVEPANQTAVTRWSYGISSLTGLGDFEAEQIDLLLDGFPVKGQEVSGGALTGLATGHVAIAGFGYESRGRLLSLEAGAQNGSAQGKQRPVYEVVIDVLESRGLEAGTDMPSSYDGTFAQFDAIAFPDDDAVIEGQPLPLYTGLIRVSRDEQGEVDNPSVAWRQADPLPSIVRGIIARLSESDGR